MKVFVNFSSIFSQELRYGRNCFSIGYWFNLGLFQYNTTALQPVTMQDINKSIVISIITKGTLITQIILGEIYPQLKNSCKIKKFQFGL